MPKQNRVYVDFEICIKSDIESIWELMTNFENYNRWNPFITKVKVIDRFDRPNLMVFDLLWFDGKKGKSKEEMISAQISPTGTFEQRYKYASIIAKLGLVKAERIQTLRQGENGVIYYSIEEYHGLLKNLIPISRVHKGFERQAKALKEFCEIKNDN